MGQLMSRCGEANIIFKQIILAYVKYLLGNWRQIEFDHKVLA